MQDYGFNHLEIRQIVRNKPTFLLFEEEYSVHNKGIKALEQVLCQEFGFGAELMKTLVVKYPQILSKTEEDMRQYFKIMNNYEIGSTDAMDYLS
tara:strand:+ start:457 stop:738 length:282 start_codon:yes stop_codon:yes gene_type:complete